MAVEVVDRTAQLQRQGVLYAGFEHARRRRFDAAESVTQTAGEINLAVVGHLDQALPAGEKHRHDRRQDRLARGDEIPNGKLRDGDFPRRETCLANDGCQVADGARGCRNHVQHRLVLVFARLRCVEDLYYRLFHRVLEHAGYAPARGCDQLVVFDRRAFDLQHLVAAR